MYVGLIIIQYEYSPNAVLLSPVTGDGDRRYYYFDRESWKREGHEDIENKESEDENVVRGRRMASGTTGLRV